MPRAYGTDLLELGPEGSLLLLCRHAKGWLARRPRTPLAPLAPGTAVRWEDEFWEVLEVQGMPDGRVRYRLAPWDESHIFRVLQDYGEAAEEARAAERREDARREAGRQGSILLAPLLGHLPWSVQESLELGLGVSAVTMTVVSAAPLFLFGAFCVIWTLVIMFGSLYEVGAELMALMSPRLLVLGWYLFLESAVRLAVAVGQGRAIGSVAGTLAYAIWKAAGGKPAPVAEPASSVVRTDAPADHSVYERFYLVEPLLSFLSPAEQEALSRRFGFEARKWGAITAGGLIFVIGPFALYDLRLLLTVGPGASTLFWLAVHGALVGEQVWRLAQVWRGRAAGSVFGHAVRPFAAKLFG